MKQEALRVTSRIPPLGGGEKSMSFTRKTDYYKQPTHEFNLPAGWACPFADACKTKADRDTGRLIVRPNPRVFPLRNHSCVTRLALNGSLG